MSARLLRRPLQLGLWFALLTLPVLGVKLHASIDGNSVEWRVQNCLFFGIAVFVVALIWQVAHAALRARKRAPAAAQSAVVAKFPVRLSPRLWPILALILIALPFLLPVQQLSPLLRAMLFVMLGLGLNIVVGLTGQLVLGYAAFYAVGAYTYGILHHFFGLGFWPALPLGGLAAGIFGILLGFPVLRLRGDYLAIATLGFGEITVTVLTNLGWLTQGPNGITNIPRPSLPGLDQLLTWQGIEPGLRHSDILVYYLLLLAGLVSILAVARLKNSRVGRSWQALREDEIACQAMGINLTRAKLSAFALGSCWAGFAGVLFAAKDMYINPNNFTFETSAVILSIVVLGGIGSTMGVVLGALLLILLPEYLRVLADYRMLMFGALMVMMMVFRPQGIIPPRPSKYRLTALPDGKTDAREAGDAPNA